MGVRVIRDLGYADCEQCGGSPESLEFYWDDDERCYFASVQVGCYGGETTSAVDPEVALDIFGRWGHIREVARFVRECRRELDYLTRAGTGHE